MKIRVPGPAPAPAREKVTVRRGKVYRYPSAGSLAYMNRIRACWRAAARQPPPAPPDQPVFLLITIDLPVPPSDGNRQREEMLRGRRHPVRRPDTDRFASLVCGALTGLAFADRRQIIRLETVKRYAREPGVTIETGPAIPCPPRRAHT